MKGICFLILSCLQVTSSFAVSVDDVRNMQIPMVIVKTVNGEIPTCEYVYSPEGCDGVGTTNQTKVSARMFIIIGKDTLYDSGEYEENVSGLSIRIRGNTSAYQYPMKPYKLKLQKKADLLLRGDNKYADKEWLLLNFYRLNTMVSNKVSELVGIQWHPECEYVNFFLNEDYQGLYLLSESMKRNPDCRIDVDKNEGYLFENDAYWWNEPVYADTHVIDLRYNYTFKYPDNDDITTEQVNYISSAMDDVETSIQNGTYPEKIDVESFAKWLLVHDIIGTIDAGGSNMYLVKYNQSSKVAMSCPWDFSGIMRYNDYSSYDVAWASIHENTLFYYPYLWSNKNDEFSINYVNLWNRVKEKVFTNIDTYISDIASSSLAADIRVSRKYTADRWYAGTTDYNRYDFDPEINGMHQWFTGRKGWLDENIQKLLPTGITEIDGDRQEHHKIYNLQGMGISSPNRQGIYIIDGKKFLLKK